MSSSTHVLAPRAAPAAAKGALVVLLALLALLLGAAPAFAHTRLQSSDPAEGSSTASGPQRVSLTFNEPVQSGFATLTLIGPDGQPYQSGEVKAAGDTVSIGVSPLGPAGRYEIGYRVISEDGHPVTGSVGFTLTAAGPAATPTSTQAAAAPSVAASAAAAPPSSAAPAPAAATTGNGSTPVWPWVVGGVVLVAVGAGAALRLGRG
jgi:copper resistance protein C